MFEIRFKQAAHDALGRLKKYHARQIVAAIELNLRHEPERISRTAIKRLRGKHGRSGPSLQRATYRVRVGDYRVFYDVGEDTLSVVAVLHKSETAGFYEQEEGR
jgi:mRNA interferase RelE/StbE